MKQCIKKGAFMVLTGVLVFTLSCENAGNTGDDDSEDDTTISISAVPGVTPPVIGETPVTSITETDQFTGTVSWSPDDDPFASGTVYTATVTLTAKSGYTTTGVAADFFTVSGAATTNPADSGVVTAVFPATLSGTLTHIDSDDQGGKAYGVWGDGSFIYLANGLVGIHSYSVDGSGNLTHIDSDNPGGFSLGVWGDGSFIYLANEGGGIHSYSVDGSGNLTHIDSDDQGDLAYDVWGDGSFIYLANRGGGIHSYSVDGSGNLTHIDSDNPGDLAYGVWGDGSFIYLANWEGGIHSYSVDGSGHLTWIDSDDPGDSAEGVWGDGSFIYLANGFGGIHSYKVE